MMRCIKMSASGIIALVVAIGLVQGQQPTSFTFDGIRYTFYPGEVARTWAEANGFCKSLGKELAVFANRAQVRNVSEYLSPDGGVWTGYKTNTDCKFESVELADFEWKKEFGTPLVADAKAKQCGLLSVANYTGIVPTDCTTKKAALCSLSNPDAVEAEAIRDSRTLPKPAEKVEKASNGTAARPPAPLAKSAGAAKAVKPTKDEKESDDADVKAKGAKAAPGPSKAAAKPAAEKVSSDDEITADSDVKKHPAEVVKKPAADPKPSPEKKTALAKESKPSSAELAKPSAAESKPSSESKKPAAESKKTGGSDAKQPAAEGKKSAGGDVKQPAADAKKASSDQKTGDVAPNSKAKPAQAKPAQAKPTATTKKDADADAAAVAEGEADEEATPPPTTRPPTNQLPIQIESEGGRFTFFPNHIMFGGYMEYSRFCEDKGLQPAVFTTRSQLDDVASHINSVVMVWTGYSTDSKGNVHSVDEASAAWQPEYEIGEGGTAMPSLMCGALSTAANKIGVTMNSCASAHEALCSAKAFSKKYAKK